MKESKKCWQDLRPGRDRVYVYDPTINGIYSTILVGVTFSEAAPESLYLKWETSKRSVIESIVQADLKEHLNIIFQSRYITLPAGHCIFTNFEDAKSYYYSIREKQIEDIKENIRKEVIAITKLSLGKEDRKTICKDLLLSLLSTKDVADLILNCTDY